MNITIRKVVDNVVKNYNPFFLNIDTDQDIRTGLNLTPFWQFLTSKIVRTV